MKTHGVYAQVIFVFPAAFTPEGQRRSPAFVLLFAVFDESKSWYGEVGERRSRERFRKGIDRKEYHTINGYVNDTLPGLFHARVCFLVLLSAVHPTYHCHCMCSAQEFTCNLFLSVCVYVHVSRFENMSRP